MTHKIKLLLLLSFLWTVPAVAQAQGVKNPAPLTAMDIVKKANHMSYYQGKDGRATVGMRIIDSQGRTRIRQFVILRKDEGKTDGEQKFYVYFTRPADVKKMVFMVIKHIGRDDDRWLYLPALDLVKRIAASDQRTSFVGSNFFYEDVSGRDINADSHKIVSQNKNYYVIENKPKDPGSVEFASYKSWIHKATFLPLKVEYYDAKGKVLRRYAALKVAMVAGYPTVISSVMENLQTGGKTLMSYSEVKYNIGLPDNIFTERYLRKVPRKYLR